MSALFAQVNKGLAFLEGETPEAWQDGLLFAKFPRTLSAVRWGTCVCLGRAEVLADKVEDIKQVFAEEVASIMIKAAEVPIARGVAPKDLGSECVKWINQRLVAMDAELVDMYTSFDALKAKLRHEVCEEAYGEFEVERAARISALQRELRGRLGHG
jgi:hypothetical protein